MNAILSDAEFDIASINAFLDDDEKKTLFASEKRIEEEVDKTAETVFERNIKIVLVSGRSASGKTTFTKKVCRKLCDMGKNAKHVALDDFFLGKDHLPLNEDGTYNMESIKGLDVALANECLGLLLREGRADFPTFDFPNQRRGENWNRIELGKNDMLFIEGIHALNPLLTENLPEEGIMKILIEPRSEYVLDGEKIFLPDEVRLMRRMTRDELFRGWCAEKTLMQWKSVLEGEKIYIEPYIDSAEMTIDSSVESEPAVFVEILSQMLKKIEKDSPFFDKAENFVKKLSLFRAANPENLPKDSILREFVG